MNDRPDHRPDMNPPGAGAERAHVIIPGQAWPSTAPPAGTPTEPLPAGPWEPARGVPRRRTAPVPANNGAGGDYHRRRRPSRGRPSRGRRITRAVIVLVTALLMSALGTYVWAAGALRHDVDLGGITNRPPHGKGTNYLIVGSDSRQGLSTQDKKHLHTGAHGTTMTSLPRDSWTTIPAYVRPETGRHYPATHDKLNASFSYGGPELLVRTVEHNTGLRIDHYAEIGFAGFVGIVDAVGGVNMCVEHDVKDKKSGVDLKKGCQTLDGSEALAFVRQRHQEAQGDLGRTKNQQKLLTALAKKADSPTAVLDPSTLYSTANAGLRTLLVDRATDLSNLTSLFEAMNTVTNGDGRRINVPVSDHGLATSKGSAVQWDEAKARKLFSELAADRPVTVDDRR